MGLLLFELVVGVLAAAPALDPARSAVSTLSVAGRQLRLRSPDDDQVMESIMAEAHKAALAAGPDMYDDIMEERCASALAARPAYWAQVWPSAVAAGERLLAEPDLVQDMRVLELGAGLGLTACCAALAGARSVLATDREPGSASYVKANADENGLAVDFLQLDWSLDWTSLIAENAFDVAIASDVVYDHEAALQLAPLLRWAVAPGGTVLLVDAADRPYEDTRRSALLERLCGEGEAAGGEGLFELVRSSGTRVALKTRQGDAFQIAECVLRRRA